MNRPLTLAFALWLYLPGGLALASFQEELAALEAQLKAEPTNTALLFKIGDLCHDEGARDNAKAAELAEKYFKRLLALDNKHAMGMALLGSTLTMRARDAFWPKTRLDYVRRGIKTMDEAVKLAPDDPDVRLVRAINNYHMPHFLDRDQMARTDFIWIWEKVNEHPEKYKEDLRQNAALYYGLILEKGKKSQEAKQVWKEGVAINPASALAQEIRQHLK
jgi:tetratricopeptide (TPR) repeat protein